MPPAIPVNESDRVEGHLEYNSELFRPDTVRAMARGCAPAGSDIPRAGSDAPGPLAGASATSTPHRPTQRGGGKMLCRRPESERPGGRSRVRIEGRQMSVSIRMLAGRRGEVRWN